MFDICISWHAVVCSAITFKLNVTLLLSKVLSKCALNDLELSEHVTLTHFDYNYDIAQSVGKTLLRKDTQL